MSAVRAVVVAAVAALLLAGCEVAVTLEMAVDADGTGRLALALRADADALAAVDDAEAALAGEVDGELVDPLDAFAETARELGEGWEVTDRTDDEGARTVRVATTVDDPDGFAALTGELAAALDTDDGRLLGPVEVTVDDQEIHVDGELAAIVEPAADVADLPAVPLTATLTATLPGPILDADADAVDDRRVTWEVHPGEERTVHAVAERPRPIWIPVAIAGAVALAALLTALLVWMRRRRP